ncbi:hypothetical protein P879_03749 [Paragonimus westermani]|uniref:VWFC domain-containing protein n=1 Tax=Paragonimus westermani TaxID=34504 RepID=A0A8T0DAZ7_9TREM|nr:hypothetical protein P879_03749 [Paragonimus westermani]
MHLPNGLHLKFYLVILVLFQWQCGGQRTCQLEDGRVLSAGEEVQLGVLPCLKCRCDGSTGKVECEPLSCSEVDCGADGGQLVDPGACCPNCISEFFDDRDYIQFFKFPADIAQY